MNWRNIEFTLFKNRKSGPLPVHIDLPGAVAHFLTVYLFALLATVIKTRYGRSLYNLSIKEIGLYGTQVSIAIGIIILGLLAHWFKRINQCWYGRVEVFFGSLSAFAISFGLPREHISLTQYASLIGSGYVVARGLNNIQDATKKSSAAQEESA